jgi:hypothetical protein
MSVQVWFDSEDISIRPGEAVSLSLAVENVGDHTESYTIIPAGLTASWTAITRPNVTLFGGSRDVIEVIVRPPAIHSTSSGPTSVAVRVVPQGSPDDTMTAETIVNVQWFDDRRIVMLQPLKRGRRRATYEFMVDNQGNSLANCRLHLIDASGRVDGSFDPPAVGVAPGSANLVRLKLTASRSLFRGSERQLNFEIEATEPDHAPVLGRATLIQPPTVSARSIGQVLATGLAVVAVIAAWFGIVRPELRDAADRAVERRLGEITPTETTTDASPVSTTIVTVVQPEQQPSDSGRPVDYRIQVDAGITQDRSESISVPPDSRFLLTDIVLQNPHFDSGTAQLLRNGDKLYEWDLGEMTSPNEFQPRVTPLPFEPTDNIVLSVTCGEITSTTATSCEIAVLLGGQLVPVTDGN